MAGRRVNRSDLSFAARAVAVGVRRGAERGLLVMPTSTFREEGRETAYRTAPAEAGGAVVVVLRGKHRKVR
ncbi:hypothetical protein [Streptomyces sp. Je 1-369]|uniref:hypothetical protein n=1 Tax=Streptomyces sp. Je 1-369 TaxID=2966192 RepID=UPI002285AE95|nr:hypothetical protein [Streptomyces sp. Je 1-369]WAL99177.1 hypothetical protein NOO62_34720 [Streptomyces sp. Je 1-369]